MRKRAIRERWAVLTNEHLREQGLKVRVDHRSLRGQGINREPTTHLGAAVDGMERRGNATKIGNRLREERRQIAAVQVQERVVIRERRVQLERAALVAERRVERRQDTFLSATPEQINLFTRRVVQAQAL